MALPIVKDIKETSGHDGCICLAAEDGGDCVLVGGVNAEDSAGLEEILVDEEMSRAAILGKGHELRISVDVNVRELQVLLGKSLACIHGHCGRIDPVDIEAHTSSHAEATINRERVLPKVDEDL